MTERILIMEGITKSFPLNRGELHVLREAGLEVRAGECVVLIGPSGSGKSTLLNIAAGLDGSDSGRTELLGDDLGALGPKDRAAAVLARIGFVHQAFHLIPFLTARENVEMPLRLAGSPKTARIRRAAECLEAVGLRDRIDHRVTRLSGGEQQRVGIARAIANRPRLILADEPTGNLDERATREIVELLFRLCKETGAGTLLVTHDASVAARADRVLEMREGRVHARAAAPAFAANE